ncbi:MAG: peroxiredoxin [Deltaproteobacteria bacterium]|nr:peroxiredoxin [Deltaproteobacteria bacterium]
MTMTRALRMLAVVPFIACAAACATGSAERPKIGALAPAFSLETTAGKKAQLSDYAGKTLVLAFFPKAFTGGCTQEMKGYQATQPKFVEGDAQILGVSVDDLETQKKFAESLGLQFPLMSDPEGTAAKAYGVYGMMGLKLAARTTFVIDGTGHVVQIIEGKDAIDPASALEACPLHKKGT